MIIKILLRFVIAAVLAIGWLPGVASAQTYREMADAEWQRANSVWQQAHLKFQQAGVDYQNAGADYLRAIATASDQGALEKAQADWQAANIAWQQAGIHFQTAGAAYITAGSTYLTKFAPIQNPEGEYTVTNPMGAPVVVVNNGSVVHIRDLIKPFDKLVPSEQGPGKFGYNWVYWDRVYGYAYLVLDEAGVGHFLFEFTDGEGYENSNDNYSAVAVALEDGNGENLALFGVATYIHGDRSYVGIGSSPDNAVPIGGPKNHGHAHSVKVAMPVDWWNKASSFRFAWKVERTLDAAEHWLAEMTSELPSDRVYIAK
jgi:hypothetical protein